MDLIVKEPSTARTVSGVEIGKKVAAVAWLVAAVYYFYQYALRSAPAVMMPQLSEAFGISALGVASIAGLFYYGYSPFSLIAGAAMDKLGPRRLLPYAAAAVGVGAFLFATGNATSASIGRFIQGAAGVFALVGAIYIATKNFPASQAATLIGATQMFGMAGGSAGQFVVGPIISKGIAWSAFWSFMGVAGVVLGALLFFLIPREEKSNAAEKSSTGVIQGFIAVFKNPQSILCGLIAGLIMMPTSIFDMIWGVRFLEQAHGVEYSEAVLRSATVPFGWIIGCPLLGFISDRIGRRKPVMIGGAVLLLVCLTWILYGPADVLPPYVLGLLAGIGSGAGMLQYSVVKESNPANLGGTAAGVTNFINFTLSALLGPIFGLLLQRAAGGSTQLELGHFRTAFTPLIFGVGLAVFLAFLLKETGTGAQYAPASEEAMT